MKRYLILLLLLFLPITVKASCSDEDLVRLQKIANNVNVSYKFDDVTNRFVITFSNLRPELVITDIENNVDYRRSGDLSIDGAKAGNHTYYIYAYDKNCYDNEIGTKSINIPYYNEYYDDEECKDIKSYKYCSKWLPNEISYKTWYSNVTKYKKSIEKEIEEKEKTKNSKTIIDYIRNLFIDLYVDNYYIFLPITILALCAIIYLKNKSDQLI